jgi:glycine/sarcosine N-methyltransferase
MASIHGGEGSVETSVLSFYDDLASHYHLIFKDFKKAVRFENRALNRVIRKYHPGRGRLDLLDCSCGIGTQALGLARYGYRIHATDLSPKAVREARKRARLLGFSLTFGVADFRKLSRQVKGQFDVVLSCDNALPHLLTDRDILSGLRNIRSKLKPGGLCLLGIRDYDPLLKARPVSPRLPAYHKGPLGERIYFQVWDWKKGSNIYKVNLFLLRRLRGKWKTQCHVTCYRAIRRAELTRLSIKAGFSRIRWLMPEETGYIQPLAAAFNQ